MMMTGPSYRRPHGRAPAETGVVCPGCRQGALSLQTSCLRTAFVCTSCRRCFDLSELAKRLDNHAFARLAEAVQWRLSDRV